LETDFGDRAGGLPPGKPHHYVFTVYALKTGKLGDAAHGRTAIAGFTMYQNALAKASITALLDGEFRVAAGAAIEAGAGYQMRFSQDRPPVTWMGALIAALDRAGQAKNDPSSTVERRPHLPRLSSRWGSAR
jgi:hypothetical protein